MESIIAKINAALNETNKEASEKIRKEIGYIIGSFDNGDRYTISEEYRTNSSDCIRNPSRRWNLSEWKHIKTNKFLKQLKEKLEAEIMFNKVL